MAGLIYTTQKSKLSKKQRAAQEALMKEQRAIKLQLKAIQPASRMSFVDPAPAVRTTRHIPSRDTGGAVATLKPTPVYTGDKMIGIGQLHKSNAVPVFRAEDAEDIARMRR